MTVSVSRCETILALLTSSIAMRIEWSRALARKTRWEEEVMLVREEMRRVLRYLAWQGQWWEERKTSRGEELSDGVRAGLAAYAARQSAFCLKLAQFFKGQWSLSIGEAAKLSTKTRERRVTCRPGPVFRGGSMYVAVYLCIHF